MTAKANDLVKAGKEVHSVTIEGVAEPIDIVGMTIDQAIKFSERAQNSQDFTLLYAYLVKQCCPAFRRFWWTPNRIKKNLSLKMMLALADKIMEVSGYSSGAVDDAVKT